MTLIEAILKKVQSVDSVATRRLASPPPELKDVIVVSKMKNKLPDKFRPVRAHVSPCAPRYESALAHRKLVRYELARAQLARENFRLLTRISRQHYARGKVDTRWRQVPPPCLRYHAHRVSLRRRILAENQALHRLFTTTTAAVIDTGTLQKQWSRNRRRIVQLARRPFVLFMPVPSETVEDEAFRAPTGVVRPRVQLTLKLEEGCSIGSLCLELFTDVSPATCRLFLELLAGDPAGFGYVGTRFFR